LRTQSARHVRLGSTIQEPHENPQRLIFLVTAQWGCPGEMAVKLVCYCSYAGR